MGTVCPSCGGNDTRQIAPGFWECREADYVAEGHGRDIACRHQFHAGPSPAQGSPLCSCGTFAIGACAVCGTWVCGDHSALWPDKGRLCLDEAEPRQQRQAEEQYRLSVTRQQELVRQHEEERGRGQPGRDGWRSGQVTALALIAAGVLLSWQGSRSQELAIAGAFLGLAVAHGIGKPISEKDEPFWTSVWAGVFGALGGYILSLAV